MSPSADRVPLALRRWMVGLLSEHQWQRLRPIALGQTPVQRHLRDIGLRRARARAGLMDGNIRAFQYRGSVRYGHVVERPDAAESQRTTTGHVGNVLNQQAAVDAVLLDQELAKPVTVVVPQTDRAKTMHALKDVLSNGAFYARTRIRGQWRRARLFEQLDDDVLDRAEVVRIFRFIIAPDGTVLFSEEAACEIEFWHRLASNGAPVPGADPLPAGSLLASSRNRRVSHLKPSDWEGRERSSGPIPLLSSEEAQYPHVYDLTAPIDIVYTWVDDEDPEWRRKKQSALAEAEHGYHTTAVSDSRYKSHDELRYSLRSLEMYANWYRNIYIVTDDQVPEWLDISHPKLTLVSHKSLFGERGKLPTFNSHAIESQLHNIAGLSEHFLYINDDVFFGRPISPSLFFQGNGVAQFFPSKAKLDLGNFREDDAPVMSAAKNNRNLLERKFQRTFTNKMKHVPHALRLSVLEEMESTFPEEHNETSRNQFRDPRDCSFVSSLHHWFAYCTGRAIPSDIRYFYADIGRRESPARLEHLLRRRNIDVFCLNDHDVTGLGPEERTQALERFLTRYFPLPSSFELPADCQCPGLGPGHWQEGLGTACHFSYGEGRGR